MKVFFYLFLFTFFIQFTAFPAGDFGFSLGYGFSHLLKNPGNKDILLHNFNQLHGNYSQKMESSFFNSGFSVSSFIGENSGVEINWTNNHDLVTAKESESEGSAAIRYKFRLNNIGVGIYIRPIEQLRFGILVNRGYYAILLKNGAVGSLRDSDYKTIHDNKVITKGMTLYVDLILLEQAKVRPYYYIDFQGNYPVINDKKLYFNLDHLGLTLSLLID
ncbi:hypothetical protein ACFLSA_01390 [Bacteroidota bacterium]